MNSSSNFKFSIKCAWVFYYYMKIYQFYEVWLLFFTLAPDIQEIFYNFPRKHTNFISNYIIMKAPISYSSGTQSTLVFSPAGVHMYGNCNPSYLRLCLIVKHTMKSSNFNQVTTFSGCLGKLSFREVINKVSRRKTRIPVFQSNSLRQDP